MTLKRRLFFSNLLMLVIPALLAVLVLVAALGAFAAFAAPADLRLSSQHERQETRARLTGLAGDWLAAPGGEERDGLAARLDQACRGQNACLVVYAHGAEYTFGQRPAGMDGALGRALDALDGAGTVSDGRRELTGGALAEGRYRLYSPVPALDARALKQNAALFLAASVAAVLAAVAAVNRFLTRFVLRHITRPLQTLADGAAQIRDGNLDHRIVYDQPDEFAPVCAAFNEMAGRLRDSVQKTQREEAGRKELLASISHDIRSPLTAIRAYVEGLIDGVADTPQKQAAYLDIIRARADELDRLVKKLFLFSKMDLGEYPYAPELLDPAGEIREFLAAAARDYRRQGLAVEAGPLPEGAWILADPTYFRSILTNLLDNCARYKAKPLGAARLDGRIEGCSLVLAVSDDGPGVPEQALPRLFDVFYRADPARRPAGGSGLGLAIVARAAARMGGRVSARNLPDGGLCVTLTLPLAAPEKGDHHETDPDH
ncbi:MAG TPA: HAMP domain-containing histidine kinase [Candidatus Gemmiger faecigallinarum]|nr:HAMP domain-containing histidine kinase [Candidatus Gemmiger faecigallinarum]